jgi:hypothetical protein
MSSTIFLQVSELFEIITQKAVNAPELLYYVYISELEYSAINDGLLKT